VDSGIHVFSVVIVAPHEPSDCCGCRVKPGDKIVRVYGFDCMGVPRAVIRSRVLGPQHSEGLKTPTLKP